MIACSDGWWSLAEVCCGIVTSWVLVAGRNEEEDDEVGIDADSKDWPIFVSSRFGWKIMGRALREFRGDKSEARMKLSSYLLGGILSLIVDRSRETNG